jgi:hypothetical protein
VSPVTVGNHPTRRSESIASACPACRPIPGHLTGQGIRDGPSQQPGVTWAVAARGSSCGMPTAERPLAPKGGENRLSALLGQPAFAFGEALEVVVLGAT